MTCHGITQKCYKTVNDIQLRMQHLRCAPIDTNLPSSSEIMFNCSVRTNLARYHPTLVHQKQMNINDCLQVRRGRMIQYHDRNAGPDLATQHAGQRVRILIKDTHTWRQEEVVATCAEPRSYIVQTPNGQTTAQNQVTPEITFYATPAKSVPMEPEPLHRHVRFHEDGNSEHECDNSAMSPMNKTTTTNEQSPSTVHVSHRKSHTMMTRSGREIRKPSSYCDD